MIYRIQLWMHRIFLGVIPVLSVVHIIGYGAYQWDELTSETNLLRPWLICYPLCQLLLAGTYLGLLDVQLAQTMAPNTIKRIDKVIGREELNPAAKTRCCGPAKDNIIERNICEAAMYTIQPRFQFYDEVVRELEQETEQYTDEDGVQKYYNIEKARLEQLDEDMKYKMVE